MQCACPALRESRTVWTIPDGRSIIVLRNFVGGDAGRPEYRIPEPPAAATLTRQGIPVNWQTAFTLVTLVGILVGLVRYTHLIDVIFVCAVVLFALVGIITPAEAFAGFANEGMLTVAALFVVAAGVTQTGLLTRFSNRILGHETHLNTALLRIVAPVAILSAVLNNTTCVAMALPAVLDWARKHRVAPSKLLLPLSFAAILGGVCTLIGTSTNLVTHGMLKAAGMPGLGMWELGVVGVPIALLGGAFLILAGPRLLPDRKEFMEQLGESRREFLVEMIVQPDCPLAGVRIQQAGLRNLPGLFLISIERDGNTITAVSSDEVIRVNDRLTFTGVVSTIVDLQRIRGLVPAVDDHTTLTGEIGKGLCEAVISTSSPLIGRSIRAANFRTIYDTAVIAVHRNGERLQKKIGDIVLRPGDTLLLMTSPGFLRAHRNNPDFYLVSQAADAATERHHRAWIAGAIALAMIAIMTVPDILSAMGFSTSAAEWLDDRRVVFAFIAAGGMIVTGCVSASSARRRIDWSVLIVIAAAFGISRAMQNSGAADYVARLVGFSADAFGDHGALAAIYLLTWILTEFMSNNAAAALMFPISVAAATRLGVDPRPFVIAVTIAASGGFISPVGYQAHLMVFGPGGYKQSDFLRIGLPMALLWFLTAWWIIPIAWPFR